MTGRDMERRLVELGQRFVRTSDPAVQAEYRSLHAEWMSTKQNRDHTETACNRVVTIERDRFGDHVTTRIPTEYARGKRVAASVPRGDVYSCGHVVTDPVPQLFAVETSGHRLDGSLANPTTVQRPAGSDL